MGALLAALSSLLWGTGDFLGGTLSRRAHPVAVIGTAHALAATVLVAVVTVTAEWGHPAAVPWGMAAGLVGSGGLTLFYAALARGTMGIVAPIGATGVIVPVVVGVAQGDDPSAVTAVGLLVTIVGVVLVSGPERTGPTVTDEAPTARGTAPVVLALVAAVMFGSGQVLIAEGSEHSVALSLFSMRATTALAAALMLATALRAAARPERRDLRTVAVISATDTVAVGTFAVATTLGALSVSAVLASLYPAVTAVLAWRVHHEQLRRIQVAGAVVTLLGVALIAAG